MLPPQPPAVAEQRRPHPPGQRQRQRETSSGSATLRPGGLIADLLRQRHTAPRRSHCRPPAAAPHCAPEVSLQTSCCSATVSPGRSHCRLPAAAPHCAREVSLQTSCGSATLRPGGLTADLLLQRRSAPGRSHCRPPAAAPQYAREVSLQTSKCGATPRPRGLTAASAGNGSRPPAAAPPCAPGGLTAASAGNGSRPPAAAPHCAREVSLQTSTRSATVAPGGLTADLQLQRH
ncbi:hypothetical protein chiPu_0022547 [Chiloscyllium punctatum]|uniref:Uncharacterized protein n=1 Tax=Chiloscyllium punctatum TaxID=137246 RepID=A0A401RDT5_CHIPU|nr:hypothetical protein [Chiloscyllium punctatum]